MKPVGVFYATREGHTKLIAERVGEMLESRGFKAEVHNLRQDAEKLVLSRYAGVIMAASVHCGEHERELVNFAKWYHAELQEMPAAFLSVTLSEAGVERKDAPPEKHAQFESDVHRLMDHFYAETGWFPKDALPVAGALPYTQYNPLVRVVMKYIAKASGGDTDTSRDYDYTDWKALEQFVESFAGRVVAAPVAV